MSKAKKGDYYPQFTLIQVEAAIKWGVQERFVSHSIKTIEGYPMSDKSIRDLALLAAKRSDLEFVVPNMRQRQHIMSWVKNTLGNA